MREKLRTKLTYANLMSTLAVFMVVAGGGAYAAVKLKTNQVKSKHIAPDAVTGADAAEATFGEVPSAATAKGVSQNAIGPGEIQNPTRSINIPVASLTNGSSGAPLDYTPSDGTSPDLFFNGLYTVVEWDDDSDAGGSNVGDTAMLNATISVPPDYVSGGTIALSVTKDDHTGVAERIRCQVTTNDTNGGGGSDSASVVTTRSPLETHTLDVSGAPHVAGGGMVFVACGVDDGSNFGSTFNDKVYLFSMDWRYTASQ